MADADLSTANSSPESPLQSKGRAASLLFAQLTASTVPYELDQPGGISSCQSQLGSNNRAKSCLMSPFCLSVSCQAMIKLRSAGCCNGSALSVRLPLAEHLPDDRGQFSHHRHPGNGASAPAFDSFVPLPQSSILPQRLVSDLCQQPPGETNLRSVPAASLGDSSEPLTVLSTIATPGRQAPVVGQAPRSWKTFHSANTASQ